MRDGDLAARWDHGVTVLGAANHDPVMFDGPDVLRLDRPNAGRDLPFTAGIRCCLGARWRSSKPPSPSARSTGGSRRGLAGEPHRRDHLTIRGVDRLPLSW